MTNDDIRTFIKNKVYKQGSSITNWAKNKPVHRSNLNRYINSQIELTTIVLLRYIDLLGYEIKIVKKKRKKHVIKQLQTN